MEHYIKKKFVFNAYWYFGIKNYECLIKVST